MRRNIHYKPSKSRKHLWRHCRAVRWAYSACLPFRDMGALIGFKAIWCLMAFGMGIYYFLMAAGVVKYNGGYEITDEIGRRRKGRQV